MESISPDDLPEKLEKTEYELLLDATSSAVQTFQYFLDEDCPDKEHGLINAEKGLTALLKLLGNKSRLW